MKNLRYLALGLLILPLTATAQHGTVRYERVTAINFDASEILSQMNVDGLEEALAKMPKERTTYVQLAFSGNASVLTEEENNEGSSREVISGSTRSVEMRASLSADMQFTISGPVSGGTRAVPIATYVNFDDETFIEARDFMSRTFLVEGERESYAWKLSSEEKSLLGYRIMRATAQVDTTEVVAWFAPEIPVPGGPALYGGLPGLILMLQHGDDSYMATAVDLETTPEIVKPKKGRRVTSAEFDEIVADKLEELEAVRGGGKEGSIVIIRQ